MRTRRYLYLYYDGTHIIKPDPPTEKEIVEAEQPDNLEIIDLTNMSRYTRDGWIMIPEVK